MSLDVGDGERSARCAGLSASARCCARWAMHLWAPDDDATPAASEAVARRPRRVAPRRPRGRARPQRRADRRRRAAMSLRADATCDGAPAPRRRARRRRACPASRRPTGWSSPSRSTTRDPQQQQLLDNMLRAIGVGLVAPDRERRAVFCRARRGDRRTRRRAPAIRPRCRRRSRRSRRAASSPSAGPARPRCSATTRRSAACAAASTRTPACRSSSRSRSRSCCAIRPRRRRRGPTCASRSARSPRALPDSVGARRDGVGRAVSATAGAAQRLSA